MSIAPETRARLEQALRNLVTKLDAMEQPLNSLCSLGHIHGMPYTGPNWGDEVTAAKALLSSLEPRYCTCCANGIEIPSAHAHDCRMRAVPPQEEQA